MARSPTRPAAARPALTPLDPALDRAVLSWGEMGGRWGVSRSVAQIHGLLYLVGRPMPADEIAERLAIARSNVSVSLRELMQWGLIHKVPHRGDRRDHFAAEADLWSALLALAAQRKAREFDPLMELVRRARADLADSGGDAASQARLDALSTFLGELDHAFRDIAALPHPTLAQLARLGGKVAKATGKAKGKGGHKGDKPGR